MTLDDEFAAGAAGLGIAPSEAQRRQLLAYLALLEKWNRVYNLTAVRDPKAMLYQHLLDSLAVLPYAGEGRLLDVGTGPGLPGIPLAIASPTLQVTLLDSNQKKTTFVRQACIELKLANATVECVRIEDYQPPAAFDSVISRAYSELSEFVAAAVRVCRPGGRLLAMKGVYPEAELARLPTGFERREVVSLNVPGLAAQRHLVILEV